MHGALEQLRDLNPGKWLLIRLDGPEAEEGTVLAAHENPELVDEKLEKFSRDEKARRQLLYVTYALPEGQDLPAHLL